VPGYYHAVPPGRNLKFSNRRRDLPSFSVFFLRLGPDEIPSVLP
jgi:hypothetical protein